MFLNSRKITAYSMLLFGISCWKPKQDHSIVTMTNGVEDYETAPGVVGLLIKKPGSPTGQFCTGTIVRNDLIMTAAHCLIDQESIEIYPYQKLACDGSFRTLMAKGLFSKRFINHPKARFIGAKTGYFQLEADIGFVIFDENTFKDWPQEILSSTSPLFDEKVTLIGYGYTDRYKPQVDGKRMVGKTSIGAIFKGAADAIKIDSGVFPGKEDVPIPLRGDSGGPMLNGKGEVVGVLSAEIAYSVWYVNINNEKIRPFIDQVLASPNSLLKEGKISPSSDLDKKPQSDLKTKENPPQKPNGHDELR